MTYITHCISSTQIDMVLMKFIHKQHALVYAFVSNKQKSPNPLDMFVCHNNNVSQEHNSLDWYKYNHMLLQRDTTQYDLIFEYAI